MSTVTASPAWPIDAMEDKPQGAAGLTYVRCLVERDDVETWHSSTQEWVDGINGCPTWEGIPYANTLVWWREKPQPSDAIDDAAQWIRSICESARGFQTVRLDVATLTHGAELADALDAIGDES